MDVGFCIDTGVSKCTHILIQNIYGRFQCGTKTYCTGSSKKNAGIIKTYHSKTVKHIEMIQVLKSGKRT
jgi:hypothetical protein